MLTLLFATMLTTTVAPQSIQDRGPDIVGAVLDEVERRLICEYFGADSGLCGDDDAGGSTEDDAPPAKAGNGKKNKKAEKGGQDGLPPGLAKRSSLPPGLQRQLDEKGRLPPGLEKKALPDELARQLPRRSDDTEIVIVDRNVLLIQAATGLVLDVIIDIVR